MTFLRLLGLLAVLSFATAPATAPKKIYPKNNTLPTDPRPLFLWNALTQADKYLIRIDTSLSDTLIDTVYYSAADTSEIVAYQPVPNLPQGAAIYWRVAGLDSASAAGPLSTRDTFHINTRPSVSITASLQRADGSRKIQTTYNVTDAEGDSLSVRVRLSADNGLTWTGGLTPDSGAFGPGVLTGSGKKLLVTPPSSWTGKAGSAFKVLLSADDRNSPDGMIYVPPGLFTDGNGYKAVVSLPFFMSTTEITQARYSALMGSNPSRYVGPRHPVDSVSFFQALSFCNEASKAAGRDTCYSYVSLSTFSATGLSCDFDKNGFRLPTEDEWELACRAQGLTDFYWGKSYGPYPSTTPDTAEISSHAVWTANDAPAGSHEIAGKKPNALGLHDMAGNVAEWVWDFDGARNFNRFDFRGPGATSSRSVKGGAFNSAAVELQSGYHGMLMETMRSGRIGFRMVCKAAR